MDLTVLSQALAAAGAVSTPPADPFFNQTTLLLHGDGTDGAQNNTFLDGSTNNFTITRNGNTTQGTFSPFSVADGQWSMRTESTGYLSFASNAAFAWGTGDFTMEAFVYATGLSGSNTTFFGSAPASEGQCCVVGTNASKYLRVQNNSTAFITDTVAFPENEWVHVCVVRSGTDLSLYKNGVRVGTATNSNSFTSSGGARVGGDELLVDLPGYLSNVRYVKGTAVYDPTQTTLTVPTSSLTAISGTSLLVCQSNRFVDNSTNAFSMTLVGTNSIQPFSPFAPSAAYSASVNGGSGYFDGTGDYLTAADSASWAFGAGNFTIEGWVYRTVGSAQQLLLIQSNNSSAPGSSFFVLITSGNKLSSAVYYNSASFIVLTSTANVPVNAWTHFAFVRTSGTISQYINGVRDGTNGTLSTNSLNDPAEALGIAARNTGGEPVTGYFSSARIIKGTGPYDATSSTLTIPTAPLTAVSGTELLCNFTNAGIFDNTGKNNLETVGNAQVDTTTKKYGTGSLEFDGTGDWLKVPNSVNIQLGTGDFTIEFWVYLATGDTGSNRGLVAKGGASTGWLVSLNTTEKVVFTYTTSTITSSGAITTNAWNHIAVVREGTGSNETKIYIGGTNDGTGTVSTDFNQTEVMYIGANRVAGNPMKGFIDDLRITKGVARYTANFTPPTKAFPDL
jgi:hypothetical protein